MAGGLTVRTVRTTLELDGALLDRPTNVVREEPLRPKDAMLTARKAVVDLGSNVLVRQLVPERLAGDFEEGLATTPLRRRLRG